ncbi:hypothetical protein ACEZLA_003648 [Vibrio cholerae]|nr:hypothetical protein [Vibrio cholerae]
MIKVELYQELKEEIHNSECQRVFASILKKTAIYMHHHRGDFKEYEHILVNLVSLFVKQYNTTLLLAEDISYKFDSDVTCLDIKSFYSISRTMHELYLNFEYLISGDDSLKEFKSLCYRYSGCLDNKSTLESMSKFKSRPVPLDFHERVKSSALEVSGYMSKISSHPEYSKLNSKQKQLIEAGKWKFDEKSSLKWNELLRFSLMDNAYGESMYHTMSQYSHMTYHSMVLDSAHNHEIDGMMCHIYVLAALLVRKLFYSFGWKWLSHNSIFSLEEQVLLIDILYIARKD